MADLPPEKSLDDFFAKRDKKKKKEKGKGKESAAAASSSGPTSAMIKKTKREKEKSTKNDNQDAQIEKVKPNFFAALFFVFFFQSTGVVSKSASLVTICFLLQCSLLAYTFTPFSTCLLIKIMHLLYIYLTKKGENAGC